MRTIVVFLVVVFGILVSKDFFTQKMSCDNEIQVMHVMNKKMEECVIESGDIQSLAERKLQFLTDYSKDNVVLDDQINRWWTSVVEIFVYPSEKNYKEFYKETVVVDSIFKEINKGDENLLKRLNSYNTEIEYEITDYSNVVKEFNLMSKKSIKILSFDYFGQKYVPKNSK